MKHLLTGITVLLFSTFSSQIAHASVSEIVIKIPYNIDLGENSGVTGARMECKFGSDIPDRGASQQTERIASLSFQSEGKASGIMKYVITREKHPDRTNPSPLNAGIVYLDNEWIFDSFAAGNQSYFSCIWFSFEVTVETGEKIWTRLYPYYVYSPDIDSFVPENVDATFTSYDKVGNPFQIKLAGSSTAFFSKRFTLADNEAQQSATATFSTAVQGTAANTVVSTNTPAEILPRFIEQDTVLTDGPGAIDYYAESYVTVRSNLTIEPGVVILFRSDTELRVNGGGQLLAGGTSAKPIIFRGDGIENWRGIILEDGGSHMISNAIISDAGYSNNDVIYVDNASLQLTNTTFQNNMSCPVGKTQSATLQLFNNNISEQDVCQD